MKATDAHYLQKDMLTNHANLRETGEQHFLLGADSFWTLKNKSPTPSQGVQQMLLEKEVKQAREGNGAASSR